MKTYFDIARGDVNAVCDEFNKMIKDVDTSSKRMNLALTTLLIYNIANIADELRMLRAAIEKKERLADK